MLDIEKIQSGNMTFHMMPTEMNGLIAQAIDENDGFANQYDVRIVFARNADENWISGDADRLNQVVTNLLSNAIKYSPKGGEVEVSIRRQESTIQVFIRDRGPGIPEEFQDRIFGKFAQADASDTRKLGGAGLGLNICKAIIDHHNGKIGFTTSGESGTTFHFELDAIATDQPEKDAAETVAPAPKILIFEAEPETASLLSVILGQGGYRTEIAASASEATAKLAADDFAAMTLDLDLPAKDGISLIKRVRRDPATKDLPIIVVAVEAADSKRQINGDAIGMIDWLDKPIDSEQLLAALRRAFGTNQSDHPRVLHVEDDPDILNIVAALIGDIAVVREAKTIQAARQLLALEYFDLVILDLVLPDGNGEELMTALRRPDGSPIKAIVFSVREISEHVTADAISTALLKSRTTNDALLATIRELIGSPQSADGRNQPTP
jgi:DNA-binding response OmpR family regulator/anti-sigma regulatory factor (Ser/Thr protein kinase)